MPTVNAYRDKHLLNNLNQLLITIQTMNTNFTSFVSKLRENKKTAELIKTANLLFNSFEPYYMWDYIARWFEECCRFVC